MKTIFHLIAISIVLGSCGISKTARQNDLGTYDDVYYTPSDEKDVATIESTPETKSTRPSVSNDRTVSVEETPEYRKYKEGEPEEIVRDNNYSSAPNTSGSNDYSNNGSYYDDDDFSYGRSLRRLRYGDGYRDGYEDALYGNYGYGNNYYSDYGFNGWNRPGRTRFWVGYNTWNGWNVGYNYGYPAWGWRTNFYPSYNNFCDPWFGHPAFYGYSGGYCIGNSYGYYNPYYNPYMGYNGYYHSGFNGYGGNNNWNNWNRNYYNNNNGNTVGSQPNKRTMSGPRETIGSNTPTTGRKDQVSPKSRSGMAEQNPTDKGTIIDPDKTRPDGQAQPGTGNPGTVKESKGRVGNTNGTPLGTDTEPVKVIESKDRVGETRPGNTTRGNTTGTVRETPSNAVTPGTNNPQPTETPTRSRGTVREIDRTTPSRGNETPARNNEPVVEYERPAPTNQTPANNGNTRRENRGRSYETPRSEETPTRREEQPTRTYEQPREESRPSRSYTPPAERNEQPSNTRQREEPRYTPPARNNDGGSNGGGNTPSNNGGNSGNPSPRGRGR